MLDITDIPEAKVWDTVTIIGQDGEENISVFEMADLYPGSPCEVSSSIGAADAAPVSQGRRIGGRRGRIDGQMDRGAEHVYNPPGPGAPCFGLQTGGKAG